jgi:2-furoate---CoA ligase
MLDLGTSFVASVARDPDAIAIVDGDLRLTYAQWYSRISNVVAAFDDLGLRPGDHVVTALQNRWQAATIHWACQLAGIVITPVNWRAKSDELDFCIENSESGVVIYEDVSAAAVAGLESAFARRARRIVVGEQVASGPDIVRFSDMTAQALREATPRVGPEAWSIMLYTSGTTSKPKGVPRRHRAERASSVAHVAQNLYGRGERTLGVMPLYHTMGVRSLIAMSLIGGAFVCLPRYDSRQALAIIETEKITNLYLVPTLYHDLVHHPDFAGTDTRSVRKLGFAGAPMTDGLLGKLDQAFKPELFVNHYGSSEIYTFTIDQNAVAKPGSAGKAGINQLVKVVKLAARSASDVAAPDEEGEIIALLAGDESFEGYWRRPDADAKSLREGWYFTGDTGFMDKDGDLFVTGRTDDMIITGGENVSPVEIESCLSLHPLVSEVAVVGLADEKWGKVVAAFIRRSGPVSEADLERFCRESGLANFKRPRKFIFVDAIPKSPVGKLLRRLLVAGEYDAERGAPSKETQS